MGEYLGGPQEKEPLKKKKKTNVMAGSGLKGWVKGGIHFSKKVCYRKEVYKGVLAKKKRKVRNCQTNARVGKRVPILGLNTRGLKEL